MRAKRASEFCLFLKHANILQLQYFFGAKSKRASEFRLFLKHTNIFNFATSIFVWSKKQTRMRAKRASEFRLFLKDTNIFQFCNFNISLEQIANEAHPSSVYFWNKQIFFNLQFCNLANIRAKRASEFCLFLKHYCLFFDK